jgi:hypothetical protein
MVPPAPPAVPYDAESALLVRPATAPAVSVPPAFLLPLQPIIPAAPNAIAIVAADFNFVIPIASSCCRVFVWLLRPQLRRASTVTGATSIPDSIRRSK